MDASVDSVVFVCTGVRCICSLMSLCAASTASRVRSGVERSMLPIVGDLGIAARKAWLSVRTDWYGGGGVGCKSGICAKPFAP